MASSLPTSRLINVAISLAASGAQAQNLSTLLILGGSPVIDTVERFRQYASSTEVANDFGTSAPEYLAASLWFQQSPQPVTLQIGRWVQTASAGGLRGAPLSVAQQALANFTAVTSGGFTVTKNGGAATNLTGVNLSGATNLNGVASLIQTALTGTTVVWNSTYSRFEITSTTTGPTSSISFLTAPGSGTDISALLGMTAANSGAYLTVGQAAETALQAVQLFDNNYGQGWYGVTILGAVNADHLAVAAYIESTNTKHIYGVTTQEAGVLVAVTNTDIAYQLAALRYNHTMVQYSSSSPYAVISAMALIMTVDYTGNSTAITLMYKNEPGIVAEQVNSSQADSIAAKRCNVFVKYNNNTAIIQYGVVSSGNFIDVVTFTDWLAVTLQASVYNLLYTATTKVPQTDAGMHLLCMTCEAVLSQAVANGSLAPGTWTTSGFGQLAQGDFMPKGFYVYSAPVATQNPALRATRLAMPIQIAAKLAGAIHTVNVAVTVNQ